MTDMSAQYYNDDNNGKFEKRTGARRAGQRRKEPGTGLYSLPERRVAKTDRRITIVNRLKNEVTDRRSLR